MSCEVNFCGLGLCPNSDFVGLIWSDWRQGDLAGRGVFALAGARLLTARVVFLTGVLSFVSCFSGLQTRSSIPWAVSFCGLNRPPFLTEDNLAGDLPATFSSVFLLLRGILDL